MPLSKGGVVTTAATQTLTNKTMTNQKIAGNAGVPSTPPAGLGEFYGIGTSNLRPGWMNESGTAETIMTDGGTTGTTLGYAQITADFSTTSASKVQVTGLSITVTVPAGGRRVRVSANFGSQVSTATTNVDFTLWEGTVGTGTQLMEIISTSAAANGLQPIYLSAILTPSAGSHTYNVGILSNGSATATCKGGSTFPGYIMAELI